MIYKQCLRNVFTYVVYTGHKKSKMEFEHENTETRENGILFLLMRPLTVIPIN